MMTLNVQSSWYHFPNLGLRGRTTLPGLSGIRDQTQAFMYIMLRALYQLSHIPICVFNRLHKSPLKSPKYYPLAVSIYFQPG